MTVSRRPIYWAVAGRHPHSLLMTLGRPPAAVRYPLTVSDRRSYLLLIAVLVVWAGNFPLGKLALTEVGPLFLVGGRTLVATPLLLGLARLAAPLDRPLVRRDYVAFCVLGFTGLVLNTTTWYWGLKWTTALNAGILGAASPIFVALGAALLLGERLRRRTWVGIALTVTSVVLTVAKGSFAVLLDLAVNRGDVIILLSQTAWVAYSLYSRAAASTLPPVWVMAGANAVGALVLVPLSWLVDGGWPTPAAAPLGWGVILYGAVPITIAHLWYYQVIRRLGPARTAAFMNLMPFVVLAMSWALVGEQVHAYHVAGAVLVIAGVALTTSR
jgi:drug/metabolite transporter (DMT)-like permease